MAGKFALRWLVLLIGLVGVGLFVQVHVMLGVHHHPHQPQPGHAVGGGAAPPEKKRGEKKHLLAEDTELEQVQKAARLNEDDDDAVPATPQPQPQPPQVTSLHQPSDELGAELRDAAFWDEVRRAKPWEGWKAQDKNDKPAGARRVPLDNVGLATAVADDYDVDAALVLGHTIKKHAQCGDGAWCTSVALVSPDRVHAANVERLKALYDEVIAWAPPAAEVPGDAKDKGAFAKVHALALGQFSLVAYLDPDSMLAGPLKVFLARVELPESGAPWVGARKRRGGDALRFHHDVMVFRPSRSLYAQALAFYFAALNDPEDTLKMDATTAAAGRPDEDHLLTQFFAGRVWPLSNNLYRAVWHSGEHSDHPWKPWYNRFAEFPPRDKTLSYAGHDRLRAARKFRKKAADGAVPADRESITWWEEYEEVMAERFAGCPKEAAAWQGAADAPPRAGTAWLMRYTPLAYFQPLGKFITPAERVEHNDLLRLNRPLVHDNADALIRMDGAAALQSNPVFNYKEYNTKDATDLQPMSLENFGFVTSVSNDKYVDGGLVLGGSVADIAGCGAGKWCRTAIMVPPRSLTPSNRHRLDKVFDEVIEVQRSLCDRSNFRVKYCMTLDKLYLYSLTQFDTIFFLDADMVMKENPKPALEGMQLPRDPYWVGARGWDKSGAGRSWYFQSGFMILRPSEKMAKDIVDFYYAALYNETDSWGIQGSGVRDGSVYRWYTAGRVWPLPPHFIGKQVLHADGAWKPWFNRHGDLTELKARAKKTQEEWLEKGKKPPLTKTLTAWWQACEKMQKTFFARDADEVAAWANRTDGKPDTHVWIMRHTKMEYVQKFGGWQDKAK
eukprot:TRINITY_DN1109_c3_g1_i1.p1 TRINITY_DN1109_c3_g1~~TRINITY_DN1109_c3_g1_i1.p1  ORF type:complete len:840 (+),score=305.82 TRINITY_DN1109_c3_g1_i1:120-2639(+)